MLKYLPDILSGVVVTIELAVLIIVSGLLAFWFADSMYPPVHVDEVALEHGAGVDVSLARPSPRFGQVRGEVVDAPVALADEDRATVARHEPR